MVKSLRFLKNILPSIISFSKPEKPINLKEKTLALCNLRFPNAPVPTLIPVYYSKKKPSINDKSLHKFDFLSSSNLSNKVYKLTKKIAED